MPTLTRQAPGYYTATLNYCGAVVVATIEQTDIETREMYGYHGWFWKLDGPFGLTEQSEIAWQTKRDAEWSLGKNWAQLFTYEGAAR